MDDCSAVWQTVGGAPENYLGNLPDADVCTVQVDVYAAEPDSAASATLALRDAIEGSKNLPAAHGIFNMTPQDHQGFDQRARVMVTIENNTWKLLK